MRNGSYKPKYITGLDQVAQLGEDERRALESVQNEFAFRTNEYYMSLIDWDDPDDPIRKIAIPDAKELDAWGKLDASNEETYTRVPGLEHKYDSVALLLVNDVCGTYCRFCFRKRLFMNENDEVHRDVSQGLEYIRWHREISDVLLTGGDPLLMSTRQLRNVIAQLRDIDHVKVIRIGSKLVAFNPYRIIDDPDLHEIFNQYSTPEKRIYLMCHFNHPRELTPQAVKALDILQKHGVITVNQTPLIAGVNDDPDVLAELFRKCGFYGVTPYYVFQCRPTLGNKPFSVPVEKSYKIFETAKMKGSGLAKRARLCISHETGKIEIVALTGEHIVFKYHRAADPELTGRVMIFKRNRAAHWFDDYTDLVDEYQLENPYTSRITAGDEDPDFLDSVG
jgi:lysine 2,3-aminomutase